MNRRRTPVLLQTYLPSGLFVVVSWISFIVPPEVVPGRTKIYLKLSLTVLEIFRIKISKLTLIVLISRRYTKI